MADTIIVRECLYGQVRVMYGDLTKEEGDVLVTPANNRLAGREGVDEMAVSYTHLTLPTIVGV